MMQAILIDGHVHYHPCFGVERFLDCAAANFAKAAQALNLPDDTLGCLFFSEGRDARYFRDFTEGLIARETKHWTIEETNEDCSLIAQRDGQPRLILIAGRQIITADNLEVLAQGCSRSFPDGVATEAVIESVLAAGALAVLPWGVGKWMGKRGKIIERVIHTHSERIFLGDNGGRPMCTPAPPLFRKARSKGICVLPGTDPFPLPWQVQRVGGYGYMLPIAIDRDNAAGNIKRALETHGVVPQPYGSLSGPINFLRANIGIRLNKNKSNGSNISQT